MSHDRAELGARFAHDLDFTIGLLDEGDPTAGIRAAVMRAAAGVIRYSRSEGDVGVAVAAIRRVTLERIRLDVRRVLVAVDEVTDPDPPGSVDDELIERVAHKLAAQEANEIIERLTRHLPPDTVRPA